MQVELERAHVDLQLLRQRELLVRVGVGGRRLGVDAVERVVRAEPLRVQERNGAAEPVLEGGRAVEPGAGIGVDDLVRDRVPERQHALLLWQADPPALGRSGLGELVGAGAGRGGRARRGTALVDRLGVRPRGHEEA